MRLGAPGARCRFPVMRRLHAPRPNSAPPAFGYTEKEPRSFFTPNIKEARSVSTGVCMTIVLTIIHVIVCFFLVIVVLLQSGKAADLAGAFGGMGSQTAFGPRGSATVLSRATTIAAAVFMVTSLSLAILATRHATASGSVLEQQKAPAKGAPAMPPTGRPSVSVTPEGGKTTTVPLRIPGQQPAGKAPAAQQPPAKQPPAPPKK